MTVSIAYSPAQAAELVGVHVNTIRQALHSTGADSEVPPLKSKRVGIRYLIGHQDLLDWFDSLPEG